MPDTPNTNTPADPTAAELDATRAKLDAAERELSNYKLRLADYENARRRLLQAAETERKYVYEPLAKDLLTALDNLDRALDAAKKAGDNGPLVTGVSATASQFLDVLRRYGVTRIECGPGTTFDPNRHEAVMQQPTADFEPGQVVQVVQQGFLLHDRVLRPATVTVAAAKAE
ncbi:MAG: heat shock protein GrpE [Gemmataceae bacterium]|nr:heat shock protein GrpE [Gemmataceae bacterium]